MQALNVDVCMENTLIYKGFGQTKECVDEPSGSFPFLARCWAIHLRRAVEVQEDQLGRELVHLRDEIMVREAIAVLVEVLKPYLG